MAKDDVAGEGGWGAELLQLAAKQRMNTDVRRTVFCIIMGSEDYVDASERLLRLPLKVHSLHRFDRGRGGCERQTIPAISNLRMQICFSLAQ